MGKCSNAHLQCFLCTVRPSLPEASPYLDSYSIHKVIFLPASSRSAGFLPCLQAKQAGQAMSNSHNKFRRCHCCTNAGADDIQEVDCHLTVFNL